MNDKHNKVRDNLSKYATKKGTRNFWSAKWFSNILGYSSYNSFRNVIRKAQQTCILLGMSLEDNFKELEQGKSRDTSLSMFGCFLVTLHADSRKAIVLKARAFYLSELAKLNIELTEEDYIDRAITRYELKRLNATLSKVARSVHVKDFQYFLNEGYLGLYNFTSKELKRRRGLSDSDSIYDFMGLTELLAHSFRTRMTIEKLRRIRNPSEMVSSKEHRFISKKVRTLIKESTGSFPEDMPLSKNINLIKNGLKKAQLKLN